MNRKQRRTASKTRPLNSPDGIFAAAVQSHRQGRLGDAERLYRQVLATDSGHADSLHRLGVIAHQQGKQEQAVELMRRAIAQNAANASYHLHLGLALDALGRLDEAVVSCRKAVALEPGLPDAHNNLGVLLQRMGGHEEALACYRMAGDLAPHLVEAHNNAGHVLLELGRPAEAQASYRRVIGLAPGLAHGHVNLGHALKSAGEFEAACACFQRALEAEPAQADILIALAAVQLALGNHREALASSLRALAAQEGPETRRMFVQCVKDIEIESQVGGLRPLLLRALRENWDRPDDLARVCADLIKQNPAIAVLRGPDLGCGEFFALGSDDLLLELLSSAPNQDLELEALLTAARRGLLHIAGHSPSSQDGLAFSCALARQCFINEYIFAQDAGEAERAAQLQAALAAALEQGAFIHPCQVAAVAAYFPLLSTVQAPRLLERSWPNEIEALLTQQIREPMEEHVLRAGIPALTRIKDDVSRIVRKQYEENPYPRWVRAASAGVRQRLVLHLRHTFPLAAVEDQGRGESLDILVAGCGTGRNAIETTQKFLGARALAIDLSLSSLAHAARKTRELNIQDIDYAQADILELGCMERRFDLIEAVGVLHHLADPFAGWRVLTALLKPHGFMLVGFYSSEGRRDLPDGEAMTANVSAADVRCARRHLVEQGAHVTERVDFFTTSTCRDLLFHVQEHRLTLAEVGGFLQAQNLRLLGFSLEDAVLAAYRKNFPDDPAAVNLAYWQAYEKDHPDIFSGMYQFWLQKTL